MIKKIISAALLLAIIFILFPLVPTASYASQGGAGFEYIINSDDSITITAYGGENRQVAVPAELDGYTVREVGESAFAGNTAVEELYISDGVKKIGASAFAGCTALAALRIPSSVSKIDGNAFSGCVSLTELDFVEGLTAIGDSAFSDCVSLEIAYLPQSLASLGADAFEGCTALRYVVVLNKFSAAEYARGCFGNAKVYAYASTPAQTRALTDSNVFSAISDSDEFGTVNYAAGVMITSYDGTAEAVVIPDTIGGRAVVALGERALSAAAGSSAGARVAVLPRAVTLIGLSAFSGSDSLEFVRMPDKLTFDIRPDTFKNCASLRSITIPEGVERIGAEAFSGCLSLTRVTLSRGVNFISAAAFKNCPSLAVLICRGDEPVCEGKDTNDLRHAFSGSADMAVHISSSAVWSLDSNRWYPNGSQLGQAGYSVALLEHECFYVEKTITHASCAVEGESEFHCPFCLDSYTETYPSGVHRYVSTGIIGGIESFRCIDCYGGIVKFHMEDAEIRAAVDITQPAGNMFVSANISFHGTPLTYEVDYTCDEYYSAEHNRVELTFTGVGEYMGQKKLAYFIRTAKWGTAYRVSTVGAVGGEYFSGDMVTIKAEAPPPGMELNGWEIDGAEFMATGPVAAVFIMPENDVTVRAIFRTADTAPPDTEPPVTEPPVTEPPVTEPPVTDPPVTEPPGTDPPAADPPGREFTTKIIIWGSILAISLSALAAACIWMFKKERGGS